MPDLVYGRLSGSMVFLRSLRRGDISLQLEGPLWLEGSSCKLDVGCLQVARLAETYHRVSWRGRKRRLGVAVWPVEDGFLVRGQTGSAELRGRVLFQT